ARLPRVVHLYTPAQARVLSHARGAPGGGPGGHAARRHHRGPHQAPRTRYPSVSRTLALDSPAMEAQAAGPNMKGTPEKELILATKPYAHEVRALSGWHLISTGLLLAALYFGIFFPASPLWVKVICSVLTGLTIARMFIIYHDHQHKAILQRSKVADWLMTAFGLY